ncbi:sensor histidine kinase [Geodermatophilus sp. SYSU D00742]
MSTSAGPPRRAPTATRATWAYLLFAVVVGGLNWLTTAGAQWHSARALFWTDLALAVAALLVVPFRRRRPLLVTTLTVAATALSAGAVGAWIVCQGSLATRRRWREILPTAGLSVLTSQVYLAVEPDPRQTWNLAWGALATAVVVAVGMYVGARRDLAAARRDRAERAEREQVLQVATARANERTRIAREMHDVLAHRLSLVTLHAGALAFRTDLTPAQTRETAGVIQANSQRALADLREILGLLRDTERGIDATGHRPQPTLGDLSALLDDERAAGAHITLRSDLADLDALPASTGRSAYRIVQEGLTNARKHAPHAAVTVELTGGPGTGLDLAVRNPLPVGHQHRADVSGGYGLVGLAERAAAGHGRLQHGPTADGQFLIRAWLPWDR